MDSTRARFLMDVFIAAYEQEVPVTKAVLLAIPEKNKDYKPDPQSMSANELALHIVRTEIWMLDSVLNVEFERGKSGSVPPTIREISGWYEAKVSELLPRIKALSDEELAEIVPFFGLQFPRVVFPSFFLPHSIHHRGQLSTYIRPMGGTVPNMYGSTAADPDVDIEGPLERYAAKLVEICG